MDKRILLSAVLLFVAVFSAGCNDRLKIDDSDKYVFGQDSQENCIAYQSNAYLAEDKDNYYYINSVNCFIYVIDKSNGICLPLCNKSDCMHDKETDKGKLEACSAFLGVSASNIIYYNKNIYYMNSRQEKDKDGNVHFIEEIIKMAMDGSGRKAVYSTDKYAIWNFKIHRGYIYAEMTERDSGGVDGADAALFRISVSDTDNISELFPYYKYKDVKGLLRLDTRFYGNHIFILFSALDDSNEYVTYVVRYDLKTGSHEIISEKMVNPNLIMSFTILNDKLVYGCNREIYKCDFNGGNNELAVDFSGKEFEGLKDYQYFNVMTNDGKYYIVVPGNDEETSDKVVLCDEDNNVTISELGFPAMITTGCDEISMVNPSEEGDRLYFLKKSGGNVTAKEIYSFE